MPLGDLDYSDPQTIAFLRQPNLLTRLNQALRAGHITPEKAAILVRDVEQWTRAHNHEKARPALYDPETHGQDPGMGQPFSPTEAHRPDREDPQSPGYRALHAASSSLATEEVLNGLQARMGTDVAPRVTTWDRADPNFRPSHFPSAEPSMKEDLEAAFHLHTGVDPNS